MPREPFWAPYQRHRDVIELRDVELDAGYEADIAVEAETWFSKEGVMDCV